MRKLKETINVILKNEKKLENEEKEKLEKLLEVIEKGKEIDNKEDIEKKFREETNYILEKYGFFMSKHHESFEKDFMNFYSDIFKNNNSEKKLENKSGKVDDLRKILDKMDTKKISNINLEELKKFELFSLIKYYE